MINREKVKAVIIILVGPLGSRNKFDHMLDTVASVKHYASPDSRIVIQDNSAPLQLGRRLQETFPDLHISRAPQNYGLYGGLYKSESFAFEYVHEHFDPGVIIMMDTDALFTGYGLEDDAIRFFRQHPNVGVMGNYLTQGEGIDWPIQKLHYQLSALGMVRDYERYTLLHQLVGRARRSGWRDGRHILGGIATYNPTLIDRLVEFNLLHREELRRTFLQVDHLYSLLCAACGMEMASFHIPVHPFAVVWRGMPISPEGIIAQGVKAFHSTRSWKDAEREWNEDEIRAFFAEQRELQALRQRSVVYG